MAQQAANSAGRTEHNNVHPMNNREWTNDKKKTNSMYKLETTTKRKKNYEEDKGLMEQ